MTSPFYTAEHEAFRAVVTRFVAREIAPYASAWDEAGEFPRALYAKAAEIGLLGLGFPEEFGGVPADQFMKIVASQELARAGAGGISASLMSHTIGAPPIARAGRPEVRARVLPGFCRDERSPRSPSPSRAAAPMSRRCAPGRAAMATITS
jgi:acyl-CoA dehydrogenase